MRRRRRFTRGQLDQLWLLLHAGHSCPHIGALLGSSASAVWSTVHRAGGIAPRPRQRSVRALTEREREVIATQRAAGASMRTIATMLSRAPSTISREIARNGERTTHNREYQAAVADERAWKRARRPKRCKLALQRRLQRTVAAKLGKDWSPRQIALWLRCRYPEELTMQVSAETIYRSLYVQARGALKRELVQHLRRGRSQRRAQQTPAITERLRNPISIAERPPEVADRAVPGHWEGDLLLGGHTSQIVTLVERTSRLVLLLRTPRRDSATVARVLARGIKRLPAHLRASLTWDRGSEMAQHQRFTLATQVPVYFCDPYSPWQRGSNENTNGLLRQYFPKGQDISHLTQRQLDAVALRLNTRPRETLGMETPAERFAQYVASTG